MLSDGIQGKWIELFAEVFQLCKVGRDEPCAILSESQSRALNVQLAELALHRLGARPFHIIVPTPRQSAPVPIRSTGASVALQNLGPAIGALASRLTTTPTPFRVAVRPSRFAVLLLDANDEMRTCALHGHTIDDVMRWLRVMLPDYGVDTRQFSLKRHFIIPSHPVASGAPFDATRFDRLHFDRKLHRALAARFRVRARLAAFRTRKDEG